MLQKVGHWKARYCCERRDCRECGGTDRENTCSAFSERRAASLFFAHFKCRSASDLRRSGATSIFVHLHPLGAERRIESQSKIFKCTSTCHALLRPLNYPPPLPSKAPEESDRRPDLHLIHQDEHQGVLLLHSLPDARKQGCHQLPALGKPLAEQAVGVHLNQLRVGEPAGQNLFITARANSIALPSQQFFALPCHGFLLTIFVCADEQESPVAKFACKLLRQGFA